MLKAALTAAEFGALEGPAKELYAEVDGMYVLQVESVSMNGKTFGLEDVAGLKKAVAELKDKAQKRQEALAAFEGIDAEEAKTALAKVKELGDIENLKDGKLQAQAKAIEEQLEAKYAKEVEKLRTDNKRLAGDLDKAVQDHGRSYLRSEALRVFAKHKVLSDWQDVMLEKVRAVTRVKPDGEGGFKIEVLHPDGTPRITNAQNSTDLMGLDELVGVDFKNSQTLGLCFEGTNASGSGAGGSAHRQATGGKHTITELDARDATKYRAAKAAAQKAGVPLVIGG